MKHLKIFEAFATNQQYLWPEAYHWLEELYPEEICFLAICSKYDEDTRSKNKPLFKVDLESPIEVQLEGDEDDASAYFEMYYNIPSKNGNCTLSFEVSANGGFTPVRTYGYYDPPEGGEPILNDVDIDSIIYLNSDESEEIIFSDNTYTFKSEFITKNDLINCMSVSAEGLIVYEESNVNTKVPVVPEGLLKKCEDIRKKYPDMIKGHEIMGRFGV